MQGRKRLLMLLLPAFLVGIIAYMYFQAATGTTPIVVAKTTINAGLNIRDDMLTTMQVPNTAMPQGALTDPTDVVGKSSIVTRAAGDIIFADILSSQEPALKDGEVFAAVPLPEALSGMIGEGSNIDVIQLTTGVQTDAPLPAAPAPESGQPEDKPVEAQQTETEAVLSQVVQNLPVYSVISSGDETAQTAKYAIVKTDKATAVKVSNIIAGDFSVIISK
jgi:Flp pilus assembly protein CpaB